MCDKCGELDKKIAHYRQMLLSIGDQITVDRIEVLIADLRAQKATLHREQKAIGRVWRTTAAKAMKKARPVSPEPTPPTTMTAGTAQSNNTGMFDSSVAHDEEAQAGCREFRASLVFALAGFSPPFSVRMTVSFWKLCNTGSACGILHGAT